MILQALYEYYQRKAADPESHIAPQGLEWKSIPYLIVIDKSGKFLRLEDTTEGEGKNKRARQFLVTKSKGRTGSVSWQTANIFWDHFGYVLGQPKNTEEPMQPKAIEDARKQNVTFVQEVKDLAVRFPNNEEIQAVSKFYEIPENKRLIQEDPVWEECIKKDGTNLTFRVTGSTLTVAENPDILSLATYNSCESEDSPEGICLITGKRGPIAILNGAISIPGGKSGAKLVGFQKKSGYDSYHKEQGLNAPISKKAEAAYTTALNTLLDKDSHNKYRLGDTSVVFWSQKKTQLENAFALSFSTPPKDNPDQNSETLKEVLDSIYTGKFSEEDETPFYILGLAPNVARISVRFWRQGTAGEFAKNLKQHFDDLEIHRNKGDRKYYPLFNLLTQVSFQYKVDNLPPNLASDITQSILDNRPYPVTLQMQCLLRIKADREISSVRAAILKAYLNRKYRKYTHNKPKDITMGLDTTNTNQAYLLGRLFAILEKIQGDAIPGANSTIKDRYYGAASTTPTAVFGRLLGLSKHHLGKLDNGKTIYYDRLLQSVISNIDSNGLPKYLTLDDQSRFAIGYYHQREELWKKRENTDNQEQ